MSTSAYPPGMKLVDANGQLGTVSSSTKALDAMLEDRAISLLMMRRRRTDRIVRFRRRAVEADADPLRDACALAALTAARTIGQLSETEAPARFDGEEALGDRGVDLWVPLVAIMLAADAEDGGTRTETVLTFARQLAGVRGVAAESTPGI